MVTDAVGADDVFDGHGHAGQRRKRFPGGDECVDLVGLRVGAFGGEREVGVEFAMVCGDTFEEIGGKFARGGFFRGESRLYGVDGPIFSHGCQFQMEERLLTAQANRFIIRRNRKNQCVGLFRSK